MKEETMTIQNFISTSLRQQAHFPISEEPSTLDSSPGSKMHRSNIAEPTPEMMEIIERLSVQAALVMTATQRKNVKVDPSSTLSSKYDTRDSESSISTRSSDLDHCN
jgi:hypothetical protein